MIDDNCQYWMDLKNKKLSSPYYPEHYFDDGIGCEWLITAPEGHIISLKYVSKNLISKYLEMFIKCNNLIFYLSLEEYE